MRSCIFVFYICALALTAGRASASAPPEADALYADRSNLASARRAADLWDAELARDPKDFESAWKLARADYWIGGHVPEAEQRAVYENGIKAGETAAALMPSRPEGHFWIAANMGAMAESFGLRAGLKYRGRIKDELETVLKLDPQFQQGSADRALGRWYFKVPGLFGGSRKQSEDHLRRALQYNPHSAASHYFYAELLVDEGRKDEARSELQQVLDTPPDPQWGPEDQDFKVKARSLLVRIKPAA